MNMEHMRQRLLVRRNELRTRETRANASLREQPDLSTADFGDVSHQTERNGVLSALSRTADIELQQVEDALRRIDSGRYTMCTICAEPIESQRLEAVPYADRCIHCAERGHED